MMKTRNIIISLLIASGLSSCFNLDLTPEGVLSTADPFTTTGEMRNYINQFYESAVLVQNMSAGGGSGICGTDINSDNMPPVLLSPESTVACRSPTLPL